MIERDGTNSVGEAEALDLGKRKSEGKVAKEGDRDRHGKGESEERERVRVKERE